MIGYLFYWDNDEQKKMGISKDQIVQKTEKSG
jgi:hypothetical protein